MKTNNSASTPTSSSPITADIISIVFARTILHCGIKDHCWPGDRRLAIDLYLNVDQVAAALNELVDEARIRIEYQGLRRFIYIIQNTQAANTPSPQKPTSTTSSSSSILDPEEGEVQEGAVDPRLTEGHWRRRMPSLNYRVFWEVWLEENGRRTNTSPNVANSVQEPRPAISGTPPVGSEVRDKKDSP